jgi:hypothetical protein
MIVADTREHRLQSGRSRVLASNRPSEAERLKGGSRDSGWGDRAAYELRQSEEAGNEREKVGKGRRWRTKEQKGERVVFMVVEQSRESRSGDR